MDIRKAITATEAGRRLGVNRETVRRHIIAGKLRAVKPGSQYLLDPAELARYEPGRVGRPPGSKNKPKEPVA